MTDKEKAKIRAKIIMSLKEGYKQKVTMTAVEYFYRHYILEMEQHGEIHIDLLNKFYERSKEMEKQQIEEAFNFGVYDGGGIIKKYKMSGEQYFNEQFKSE
jgi:hypothetical protein